MTLDHLREIALIQISQAQRTNAMPAKTRTHKITVSVTFNKPISRGAALREFKDSGDIYSDPHYTSFGWEQDDERKYPGTFKLGAAKIAKEA